MAVIEKKYTIRQLFTWNDQTVRWEPKLSSELSDDLKETNVAALPAGMTPVQYFRRFDSDRKKRVAMIEPSITAFARAWDDATYLDDLLQKFWWMSKSALTKLKRDYEAQIQDAGVDYDFPIKRSRPKLSISQIADFVSFVGADSPNDKVSAMMKKKAEARAKSAAKRAAKKAAGSS